MSGKVLKTWEGVASPTLLGQILDGLERAVCIGQKAGDFTLGPELEGGVERWPSGRCFNKEVEIRWWPAELEQGLQVLILGELPRGCAVPAGWERKPIPVTHDEAVDYLCVGTYDPRTQMWWEARYSRPFRYLEPPPGGQSGGGRASSRSDTPDRGRVYLRTTLYRLADGRTQHQLRSFVHAAEHPARNAATGRRHESL